MSVSFCIHGSPSPPPVLYRFPIERYTRSYREKSTYTRITSFVRARRVILYRSNFNTFFFSPSPSFFFGTSSVQPAYDFCVIRQCAPLLIHETYKSIPSKQFSSLSFHLVIRVTLFRNHYRSIKRNVIS